MINAEEIKKNISEAIKYSNQTQKEIAKKIGLSQQIVSSYLNREKLPAIETLANLCVALDLDANEILCITNEQKRLIINQNHNTGIINNNF